MKSIYLGVQKVTIAEIASIPGLEKNPTFLKKSKKSDLFDLNRIFLI